MSLKRAKILSTALGELGKHDEDSPFPGRYYSGGLNWCSEFVSWCYWKAGYPFTEGSFTSSVKVDGDDGFWMQRSSQRIIDWFKKNAKYVHRGSDEWYQLKPETGDYVFIGRAGSDRMHSGIVQFADCAGHLHTIEGNNSGRPVMEFSYPYYKINETDNGLANGIILGFGILAD